MSLPDAPNTLREKYYSVMAGQNDADILPDIETAPSTENRYLDYIAKHGGGGGGSTVEVTQIKTSGEKIATITVDNVPTDLYASAGGSGGGAVDSVNGKTGDVVLTASDVGALPDNTSIPSKTSDLTNDSNFVADASYVHTDSNYTATEKTKLSGIASGAEVNVQSDWSQTDTEADDYIKNKPSIPVISGKADKVSNATSGNFAGLDSNGNLTDSNKSAADFATASDMTDVQGVIPSTATTSNKLATASDVTNKQDKITQSATLTLTVNGWDSTLKTQTVTFAHDTSKRNVIDITVSELEDWAACGVVATGETASGISFKCEEIPESALTFTVCSMSVASN